MNICCHTDKKGTSVPIIVSIIIPAFNSEKYLAETLRSVLRQTFTNWECIIVDDGSTDKTASVIDSWCASDQRFTKVMQPNSGVSAARNNGVKHARGEYVLPLDSDDIISDNYLQKAVEILSNNPQITLVYCKAAFFGEKNEPWNLPRYSYKELLLRNSIFVSGVFRRKDFLRVKGYNERLHILEDWEFYIRLLYGKTQVVQIDETMFYYRFWSDNSTKKHSENKWQQCHDQVFFLHWKKYLIWHFKLFCRYLAHYGIMSPLKKCKEALKIGR